MTDKTVKETLASFEVILELLQTAEDEIEKPQGDLLKLENYLIAAQGIANTQITLLQDILNVRGS